jgi:hypothetical protein
MVGFVLGWQGVETSIQLNPSNQQTQTESKASKMTYNFKLKYKSEKGHEFAIDPKARRGFWERPNGEEGGGLWFGIGEGGALELVDYDGTACLNQSIVDKLRENGYIVDESFDA